MLMRDNERRKIMTEEQKKLAEDNHNLIYYYGKKLNWTQEHMEEMYGHLAEALCMAAINYNPKKFKTRFSTVALKYMQLTDWQIHRLSTMKKRSGVLISYNNTMLLDNKEVEFLDTLYGDEDVWDKLNLIDLSYLPEQLRRIAYLSYLGYDQTEIGEKLGITQSLVSRKLKKIRKELENAYC